MPRNLFAFATLLALLVAAFEAGAACTAANPNASVAESTPTSAFTDHGDGTVTHNLTGLTWKQCAEGLSGAGCATGAATAMAWSAALATAKNANFAGHSDWRLPNKKELESIVESCGYNPAINQTLFPATPASVFWSGSSYVPVPTYAWYVYFGDGDTHADDKAVGVYVRLVRGGQSFDSFDAQGDYTPDAFSFTAQTGVALTTVVTSNPITVAGINTVSPISIVGGTYSVNGGTYTAVAGTVNNGDTVTLKQTSSGSYGTLTTATLTIGGVAGAFDVTTLAQDTTPTAFTFTAQTGAALTTVATSNTITVAGINSAANISIVGGTYSINSGAYTAVAGTVNNGDTVTVQQTTSGSYSTLTTATLTIGGVDGAFDVTTAAAAVVNGVCGSANGIATAFVPSANLCAAGTASAVTAGSPWTWSCNGSGGGANANCSAPNQATSGGGSGRAVVSGGTWAVDTAQSAGFIPTTGHAKSPPSLPTGVSYPYGLFDFVLTAGAAGSTATITITYPAALPAGAVYWKYGPSPDGYNCSGGACAAPHWYQMPPGQAVFAGNTVTLSIVDGGVGDDDLAANGVIVDQGGPGVGVGAASVPTLSEWGMILLAGLMGLFGMAAMRRRTPL